MRGLLSALVLVACLAVAPPATAREGTWTGCRTVRHEVELDRGGGPVTIAGDLCLPETWAPGARQVDILVPGASYNRRYWTHQTPVGSWVGNTMADGRAALAYDRIGTGDSDRVSALQVTLSTESEILHQLIGRLHRRFDEVNLIGHSLGSAIALKETARYNDANRLVVTGFLHGIPPTLGLPVPVWALLFPAQLDPGHAGRLDLAGWATTRPGARSLFYDTATADPGVIAWDEREKDIFSLVAVVDVLLQMELPPPVNLAARIDRPVLVVMGGTDFFCRAISCDPRAVEANERPYYTSAPSVEAVTIPDTGHSLALHPSLDATTAAITGWINDTPAAPNT